jgi:hypothetical protein
MPAWCGSQFIPSLNPGDRCPSGARATYSVNGTNEPEAKSSIDEASTLTGTVPWNVNTGPVQIGSEPGSTYSGGIPGPDQPRIIPFNEAQLIVNDLRGKARAGQESDYKDFVTALRRYTGSALGTTDTIDEAWRKVLTDAQTAGVDAFALLNAGPEMLEGELPEAGPSGPGAYTGPRTTASVSVTAKEDVERTLNTFAVDMLGRGLTDEELKKYTAQYREQEMASPQVTTTQSGGAATTSTTEQTVSRETIAQNILRDNPMFADNVIKTDVLDMFFNRLGGASSGS